MTLKEIAWDGICFKVPESWEIGRLGRRYLLFTRSGQTVLELKWDLIKGRFNPRRMLRRLRAGLKKKTGIKIVAALLPPEWQKALDGFEAFGFKWADRTTAGRGAFVYCPSCYTATLIQFMAPAGKPMPAAATHILDSFSDHSADGFCNWMLYGLEARLPDHFKLTNYRFDAGLFTLGFKYKTLKIGLYRWGAAAALLNGQPLDWFARCYMDFNPDFGDRVENETDTILEYTGNLRPQNRFKQLVYRVGKPPLIRVRIWHAVEINKILGAVFQDRHVVYKEQLADVCDSFRSD